jgi:hypothetical protein
MVQDTASVLLKASIFKKPVYGIPWKPEPDYCILMFLNKKIVL